jgi:3-hydroxybutyryl-CoA dehydratase
MPEPKPLDIHRGAYFEEYEIGQTVTSPGRTATETDVVSFAALSGDWNPIHTDAAAAAQGPFGQRVVHGLWGLSVGVALVMRLGILEETVIAFREVSHWKFSLPIFIGDTIHVQATVSDTRPVRRLGGGLVTIQVEIMNQDGKIVQQGSWVVLVKSKENS